MFYLKTNLTHFIYGYKVNDHLDDKTGRKEVVILFNDALKTFYLRLYCVRHMVKDHSDSERGNPLTSPHGYFFRLAARDILYSPSHRQDST